MVEQHVSVPRAFASGDVCEWLQGFEICSRENKWNSASQALKPPTFLEGKILAMWIELTENEQSDYSTVKEKLVSKLKPAQFVSLDEFQKPKQLPNEFPALYLYELNKLKNITFVKVPQYGFPYPQLASLTHNGKENGLSRAVKSLVNMETSDERRKKVLHINYL